MIMPDTYSILCGRGIMASAAYLFRVCLDFKTCGEGYAFFVFDNFFKKIIFF